MNYPNGTHEYSATITQRNALDMQVCVPQDWTDKRVLEFANFENPCIGGHFWIIRREEDKILAGDRERIPCNDRDGFVHIMLDC